MIRRYLVLYFILLVLLPAMAVVGLLASCRAAGNSPTAAGGVALAVSRGERTYLAGNHDYHNPDVSFWAEAGDAELYGVIWIGAPGNVLQGGNEMGLAYASGGLVQRPDLSLPLCAV